MKSKNIWMILLLLGQASLLFPQEEEDVIVVTASKTEEKESESVEAVEVVTQEQIEDMGAKNVSEVLNHLPGVVVYNHGLAGVMMQGFEGDYVKILINGIDFTGDVSGAAPISQIPVSDIERIEIIRGASSVLYGSDAMGGVINIITKKTKEPDLGFHIGQEISTTSRLYGEGGFNYGYNNFYLNLTGSYDYNNGKIDPIKNNLGNRVDFYLVPMSQLNYVRGDLGRKTDEREFNFHGLWSESSIETSTDSSSGTVYDDLRMDFGVDGSLFVTDTSEISGFAAWKSFDHSISDVDYIYDTSATEQNLFQDVEGEIRYVNDINLANQILYGLAFNRESLGGDSFDGDSKERYYLSSYFQDTWNWQGAGVFQLVPGVRMDMRIPSGSGEDFTNQLTPKLSLRWDPSDAIVYRASYGMGYKIPTLKENYWYYFHLFDNAGNSSGANFLLIGNRDLKPETSHGFNTSLDVQALDWLRFTGDAYFNYIYDMITTVIAEENSGLRTSSSGSTYSYDTRTYVNKDEAFTTGTDFSVAMTGGSWKGSLGYSWLMARYKGDGSSEYKDLELRVPHQFNADVSYTHPHSSTRVNLSALWNAPQLYDEEKDYHSSDYLMVNFRVEQPFLKNRLSVYGGVNNLLNNFHFVDSSEGENQERYFGLYDGIILYTGMHYRY